MSIDSMDTPPIDEPELPPRTPQQALADIELTAKLLRAELYMLRRAPNGSKGMADLLDVISRDLVRDVAILRAALEPTDAEDAAAEFGQHSAAQGETLYDFLNPPPPE